MSSANSTATLIGRSVYFKLSEKQLASSNILNLTPNKMYKLVEEEVNKSDNDRKFLILDDSGHKIAIYLGSKFLTSHLDELTHFVLARKLSYEN